MRPSSADHDIRTQSLDSPDLFCHKVLGILGAGSSLADAGLDVLASKARLWKPANPINTATSFSDWIFLIDKGRRSSSSQSKERGQLGEKLLSQRHWLIPNLPKSKSLRSQEWQVVFKDPLQPKAPIFTASRLTLHGKPLKCRPDCVLKNKTNNVIMIIETKVTSSRVVVPPCGWANLAVQLWCYSWIDNWLNCPNVILLACVYQFTGAQLGR